MQNQEINKIKSLVQSSGILSSDERAEWLALLGMMNDRQLAELEKILLSDGQKSQTPKQAANFNKPLQDKAQINMQPVASSLNRVVPPQQSPKPVVAASPSAQSKLPALSHIVNLPKNFGPQAGQKTNSQGVTPEALAKRILEVKPTKNALSGKETFAAKLKNIFNEKELPAGTAAENIGAPPAVKEKTLSTPPAKPPIFTAKLAPPVPSPKENKVLEKILPVTPPKKPQLESESVNISAENVVVTGEVKPPSQNYRTQNSGAAFNAGLNLSKTSYKTTEERVAEIKQSLVAKPSRPLSGIAHNTGPVLPPAVGLETLDSLTKVDLKSLQSYNLDSIADKIKLLVQHVGYFDVIFNLEKSPLYKTYIKTGLKLLSDQQDFEQLGAMGQSRDYLNRQDFEKFTDLLSKIQTST